MKTVSKLLISILVFSSFSNNVFAGKIPLEDMKLELSIINYNKLGILIWDQRPMVADQSQQESFLGYRRAIVGIAYPNFIKSDQSLSTLLLNKIETAYNSQGIKINIIESSPLEKKDQILKKITNSGHNKVLLLKLNKLYFDGVLKIEYVVDIELQVLNSKGELLFDKNIIEKIPMGSSSKYKKTVPKTLKGIIENLLNANDVVNAINKEDSKINDNETTDKYDVIITKQGEEIVSKITEIDMNFIKYKPLSNLDGPIRNISISEVFMIKYKNGVKEVFK